MKKQIKIPTSNNVKPTPEKAPPPPPPSVPAQAKPMQAMILPQESYQAMRNWAYTNLKASEFDALMGFFQGAQTGTIQVNQPKQ